jgi:hypothetical protein
VVIVPIVLAPLVELKERGVGVDRANAAPDNAAFNVNAVVPIKKSRRVTAKHECWFISLVVIVLIGALARSCGWSQRLPSFSVLRRLNDVPCDIRQADGPMRRNVFQQRLDTLAIAGVIAARRALF